MAQTQDTFSETTVRTYFPRHDTFHRMIERSPDFHQFSETDAEVTSAETESEFE